MKTQGLKGWVLLLVVLVGFAMVAPAAFAASSSGYSATCKDGTSWTGASKRGACRGHKGVQSWTSEGGSMAAAPSSSTSTHERKSRRSKKSEEAPMTTQPTGMASEAKSSVTPAASGAVSATCKDGTSWSGKSKRGACRGHKGVASWTGAKTDAPPPIAPKAHVPASSMPASNPPTKPDAVARRAATRSMPAGGALGASAAGGGAGKVWVNVSTKTYHCPGTKWYGTTKHGQYMTEAQAESQGYHADHGKTCSR